MSAKLNLTHLNLGLAGLPANHITIYTPSPPDGTLHIALGTEETGLTDVGIFNSGGISLASVPQIPIGQYDNYSGEVVQRVGGDVGTHLTTTALIPIDDTIPQITEGGQVMSQSITPLYADSLLIVESAAFLNPSVANWMTLALFRDSTANAIAAKASYMATVGGGADLTIKKIIPATSTALTTITARVGGNSAGTLRFNGSTARVFGGVMNSYLTITEVRP